MTAGTCCLGRRHLNRILRRYEEHYNAERPHRGLKLAAPDGPTPLQTGVFTKIKRRDVLGGLIHEYHAVAA